MKDELKYCGERVETAWDGGGGAFPCRIALDGEPVLRSETAWLSCRLADGRRATPRIGGKSVVEAERLDGRAVVHMDALEWRDDRGEAVPDFRADLRFELWDDGTAFANFFFVCESCDGPDIDSFSFEVRPDVSGFESVKWSVLRRSATVNAADILPVRAERFLDPGEERRDDGALFADVSFDCFSPGKVSRYLEFFVEGHSTLSGIGDGCSSSVTWEDGGPVVRWEFQKPRYRHHAGRPWQLRNQFGWVVAAPPTRRALPPLRMYHYLSNRHHQPTPACVRKMAAAGADVLVLHECWRSDVINGGAAHDPQALRAAIAAAHECGMRVALYVRGNEQAEVEEKTDWFPRLLERGRDGLYMDFGGACGLITPPNVDYVGGRIHFRGWYLAARERRGRVGDYGLVFAHTGPAFSAVGMTGGLVTGYISGEGERGLMVRSRRHHSFFSCSGVVQGTMWTAAFPEYGSPAMVPHLAATGQYPHVPLGTQWETSSLSHPDEPGTSDRHLRPLWRIWGLFAGERDVAVGTWDNGFAGIGTDSDLTGFYAMRAKDGALLVVVSNFAPDRRTARIEADTAALGIPDVFGAFAFTPGMDSPGVAATLPTPRGRGQPGRAADRFPFDLPGYGVGALLFAPPTPKWAARIANFAKPYPEPDAFDNAFLERVARQKRLRDDPPAWREVWMRVSVPNLATPYEESLWWDTMAAHVELREKGKDGATHPLGWISPDSAALLRERPAVAADTPPSPGRNDAGIVWPGQSSPWIPLHATLGPGLHELETHSVIAASGLSFYSWIQIDLSPSPSPDADGAYRLEFLNELEPDRESIRWKTRIAE